ncbi:MAG: tRNA dihydrouridine synthase DusB [Calditrichaeota bacterium]|nr:tRNA dihydrouridine synthase DusB [Calditrichota bacterium]MBT7788420.1 tRNA dihydrouridine synthase DusB [Calditrichota bacterium]
MFDKKLKYKNEKSKNQPKPTHLIEKWELPAGEILAPMAGISDSPFRRLTRRFGSGLLYSEVISAEGTRRMGDVSIDMARFDEEERPIAIQLFGSEPSQFADATPIIIERWQPDMIDINCGCPVKRFVSRSCGGFLMQDPDLIGNIVSAVKKAADIPVSVKLRSGYRKPDETAVEAAIAAEQAGASLIAIHGKYVRGWKGTVSDFEVIGRVKSAVNVPVIGNGDILSYSGVKAMVSETGCDRVMLGRWACGRPWIFQALENGYPTDDEVPELEATQKIDVLLLHYELMLERFNVPTAVHRMRKHIGWYTRGMRGASTLRGELMRVEDPDYVLNRISQFKEMVLEDT